MRTHCFDDVESIVQEIVYPHRNIRASEDRLDICVIIYGSLACMPASMNVPTFYFVLMKIIKCLFVLQFVWFVFVCFFV